MSFILDALRKSEHERRRNETPGIASARAAPPTRSRSLMQAAVVALLAVNLAVIAFLWQRDEPAQDASMARATDVESNTNPPQRVVRALANEVTPGESEKSSPDPAPAIPESSNSQIRPVGQPVNLENTASRSVGEQPEQSPQTTPEASEAASIDDIGMPTLQEVVLDQGLQLPPMHLDIHVYSLSAADRFVFINMQKYKEGDTLSEGPSVREIVEQGVVLQHQGQQFLLTRH